LYFNSIGPKTVSKPYPIAYPLYEGDSAHVLFKNISSAIFAKLAEKLK
jgi:hypothetical protein